MRLSTITMDRIQARDAYKAYRASVRAEGHSPEDEMIARGYHALALGRSVLALSEAIKAGGLGNDGLPRIAIARADAHEAHVRIRLDRALEMWCGTKRKDERWSWAAGFADGRLPDSLVKWQEWEAANPDKRGQNDWRDIHARAMVPIVPPQYRPGHDLANYHILFEVERWSKVAPPPPRDPALLKHIGGDLYAVLAVWDLTDLERAVLGHRNAG